MFAVSYLVLARQTNSENRNLKRKVGMLCKH